LESSEFSSRRLKAAVTQYTGIRAGNAYAAKAASCEDARAARPYIAAQSFSSYPGEPRDSAEAAMTLREGGRFMNDCGECLRVPLRPLR